VSRLLSAKRLRARRRGRGVPALVLSDAWKAWIAENALAGVAPEDLVAPLILAGVPPRLAKDEVSAALRSPLLAGARLHGRNSRRVDLVVKLLCEVNRLLPRREVERRSGVSREEFFERYYFASRPVLLLGLVKDWPATRAWSPAYFRERIGDAAVEVCEGRDADPSCDKNFKAHLTTTTMRAFCDRVDAAGETNDFYLIANNHALLREGLRPLLEDLRPPDAYLDRERAKGRGSLWFGPAGTVTPLHHDTCNILFCQIYGRKRPHLALRDRVARRARRSLLLRPRGRGLRAPSRSRARRRALHPRRLVAQRARAHAEHQRLVHELPRAK
jgi:hypothetical protein